MNDKVLFITPGFPENEQDSTCVPYIQQYVLSLAESIGNENIAVVTMHYPFSQQPYTWHGIAVYPSGGKNKKTPLAYFLTLRRTRKTIDRLFKSAHFCLHAFWMGEAAFIGRQMAKKHLSRFVVTFMGQDVHIGNRVMRFIDYSKTVLVTLCAYQDNLLLENYGHNADAIIPMPIKKYHYISNKERTIDILYVGSMIPIKQPFQFVEIIAALKLNHPQIKAEMIGEGPLTDELQKQIQQLGLTEQIQITGAVPHDIVFEKMNSAKILLHTSRSEGQCLVYAEALAQGMYVVSYPVGWFGASKKHQTGETANALTGIIEHLLQQPLNFEQEIIVHAKETVNAYLALYRGGNNHA